MKIVREPEGHGKVRLDNIAFGEPFEHEDEEWCRVALPSGWEIPGCGPTAHALCYRFDDGYIYELARKTKVIPLDAELHVFGPKGGAIGEPCEAWAERGAK